MNDMVPWPSPADHADAIRDLQERFQLLERNLTERLHDLQVRMSQFMNRMEARERSSETSSDGYRNYDYSKGDIEKL